MHMCTCRRSLYFAACKPSVQQASTVQFVMRWCLFSFSPSTVLFWQSVKQIGHRYAVCFSVMSWSRCDRPVAPLYNSRACRCPWHFFSCSSVVEPACGQKLSFSALRDQLLVRPSCGSPLPHTSISTVTLCCMSAKVCSMFAYRMIPMYVHVVRSRLCIHRAAMKH